MRGIGLHREIERRLAAIGERDRARGVAAEVFHPARHQPVRRVEHRHVDRGERLAAFANEAAQHRIDETGVTGGVPVRLHQPHGEIDGGMVGHFEPEDLRSADQQRGLHPRRFGWKPACEQTAQPMAQRAEPAQHAGDEGTHQSAIALRQGGEIATRCLVVDLLVERPAAVQHPLENVGGQPARDETGNLLRRTRRGNARRRCQPHGPRRAPPHGPAGRDA